MTEHESTTAGEPTSAELTKAAGAESYQAEPVSDEELGRVWQAPSGHTPPADAASADTQPANAPSGDTPPVQEDPA